MAKIESEYKSSLARQQITIDLRIDIKNVCGILRSVLDYLAHEIREKRCPCAARNRRYYFPILLDRQTFDDKVEEWYPGLQASAPALRNYLESIQPYHVDWAWLDQFNKLNNENKHERLVQQTRSETEQIEVKMQGGSQVVWRPKNVWFGPGVSIGGVPVDPATQMPIPDPSQRVKRIVWVDFKFEGIDVSALALLKKASSGIADISTEIYNQLLVRP